MQLSNCIGQRTGQRCISHTILFFVLFLLFSENDLFHEVLWMPFKAYVLNSTCDFFPADFDIIKVVATDLDEPGNDNSEIRYSIVSQDPEFPAPSMFVINPINGVIRVHADGLDREVRLKKNLFYIPSCFYRWIPEWIWFNQIQFSMLQQISPMICCHNCPFVKAS